MSSKFHALKRAGACGAVIAQASPSAATIPNVSAAPARNAAISASAAEMPKLGRPRHRYSAPAELARPGLGERQRRDLAAAFVGLRLLSDVPGCEWLCDRESMLQHRAKSWRPGIVTELGRLSDAGWPDDEVIALAREIADAKPKTKEVVARLRALRVAPRDPDHWRLVEELTNTLDDFYNRYPTTTDGQVLHALQLAQQAWLERSVREREEPAS